MRERLYLPGLQLNSLNGGCMFFFFFGFWVLCLTCACMKNDEDLVVTIYALFSTKEISEKFMR